MKEPTTNVTEKALKIREQAKRNKPKFVRQESWRFKRLKENWRRPRGLDNKMRRKIKGWPPTVNAGYRGPKIARGLHPSGYREVLVFNLKEVKGIDPKTQAIRIAHAVGSRKRAKILVEARKSKITILNLKEPKEVAKEEEEEPEKEKEVEEEQEVEKEKPKRKKARREQKSDGGS
jgi:large subunit ribosomal protein L32e